MDGKIELYRISNAKFQNKGLYSIPHTRIRSMSDDEFNVLWETRDTDRWEDGVKHELIDIEYYLHQYGDTKGWKHAHESFFQLPVQVGVIDCNNEPRNYIVADLVSCYGGNVFKNRFSKKDTPLMVCTKKDDAMDFCQKHVRSECQNMVENILNKWDDESFLIITC